MNSSCSPAIIRTLVRSFRLLMAAGMLLGVQPAGAGNTIGGYRVLFGHLHNHSSISDGKGTPDEAYRFAKEVSRLDFFSLADHSTMMSASEWSAMKAAADRYNEPGKFTALHGFEWTNNNEGHVAVINSDDYISTEAPTSTFPGLCDWLNTHECVAFFNHPGQVDELGYEFRHFSTKPCYRIVGMELWNKGQRFERYYYRDGYYRNDGNAGWYDEALSRGWMIGAAGSEDNHNGNWGQSTDSRLAVLAADNTRTDIMNALRDRRFYSTYDNNLLLSFTIGGMEMGSVVSGGGHELSILAGDGNHEKFTLIELLRNGFVVRSWAPATDSVTIREQMNFDDREYYYVRVKQADGDEAISSPIRINGTAPLLPPAVAGSQSVSQGSLSYTFDFAQDYEGWSGDFADYPAVDSAFYELEFGRMKLPKPLDTLKYSLMITGNNHSDDLFMFIKRKFTGLAPNKTYRVHISLELASDAPTNAIGIGGAPGESVFLKAGASIAEPWKVNRNGFYEMNIDKGNQAAPGADMDTIGHIGVSDTTSVFTLISRSNEGHPFTISTDDSGTAWVCIGSDSGFEGTTTLYYSTIQVKFDNITDIADPQGIAGVILYPNPAGEMLYIDAGGREVEKIEVYSMAGRLESVVSYSDHLHLAGLPTGIYWVRVRLEGGNVSVGRVVVR